MPMIIPPMILMNTTSRPAIASPRTNFEAPSIAPKKALSSSRCLRRARASFSLMSPAERSASIAICLPGMASRLKRAATSAIRPEPLVMTTKFTITRIVNTMMPMTKLPLMTKLPNASMTWPAAAVPSCPCARIRRVDARLSASRSIVAISSTVGNDENSSGAWMNSAVIRISTDRMMEIASAKSSSSGGSGRIRTIRMVKTPIASARSPRLARSPKRKPGKENPPDCPAVTSVIKAAPFYPVRETRRDATSGSTAQRFAADQAAKEARSCDKKRKQGTPARQFLPGAWLPPG